MDSKGRDLARSEKASKGQECAIVVAHKVIADLAKEKSCLEASFVVEDCFELGCWDEGVEVLVKRFAKDPAKSESSFKHVHEVLLCVCALRKCTSDTVIASGAH